MKKILILGATGFIGKNLLEYLKACNKYQILAPSHKELDLMRADTVHNYLKKERVDVIFHCAIFSPCSKEEEKMVIEQDLRMFYHLEQNHKYYGKMVYIGSGAEYDKREDIVQVSEEQIGQRIPESNYGFAKYVIGKSIEQSENIYNFRVFGLFGKYEDWSSTFISGCCCKLIKNYPISIRQDVYFDYLWVKDFCKVAEWAIHHDMRYHSYNVTSGRRVKLSEVANMVVQIAEKDVRQFICEVGLGKEYTASNKRLLVEIGYDYVTPLKKAVQELYKWYAEHEEIIDLKTIIYGK